MDVKKIFIMLITIVACVILGAFVLNVLMPNVVTTVVNSVENMIYNASGLKLDFNGDGTANISGTKDQGGARKDGTGTIEGTDQSTVQGWGNGATE